MNILGQFAFLMVEFLCLSRFYRLLQRGEPWNGLVSTIFALLYLVSLYVASYAQAAGVTEGKLSISHLLWPISWPEIGALSWRWSLEVLVILSAEMLAVKLTRERLQAVRQRLSDLRRHARGDEVAAILLLLVGIASRFLLTKDLDERGDAGHGLTSVLQNFLVIGLAVIVFRNFFGKRRYYPVVMIGIIALTIAGVRSPLMTIAIAYIAGKVARGEFRLWFSIRLIVLTLIAAVVAASMSMYRAGVRDSGTATLSTSFSEATSDPFSAIYNSGLDTLDGYRMARAIAAHVAPDPANILTAVTNFVPRALWPNKPDDLSNTVTAKYLGWGRGGIFLSFVGYLTLCFGGYKFALVGLFTTSFFMSVIYMRSRDRVLGSVILVMVFGLGLGGSPFNIYYGLSLYLSYLICRVPALVVATRRRSTPLFVAQPR